MNRFDFVTPVIRSLAFALLLLLAVNGCGSTSSDDELEFDSGFLAPGDTYSFTFEEEGTFDYYCRTHQPDMRGQVIVSQDAESTGQDTVIMQDLQFIPAQISVAPNTEIVWVNREDESVAEHTVTSGTPTSSGGGGY